MVRFPAKIDTKRFTCARGRLREAICDEALFDTAARLDLLRWVTGLIAIPCNADHATVTVHPAPAGHLPSAATCTMELRLPEGLTAAELAEKLKLAMMEGGGFGVK